MVFKEQKQYQIADMSLCQTSNIRFSINKNAICFYTFRKNGLNFDNDVSFFGYDIADKVYNNYYKIRLYAL